MAREAATLKGRRAVPAAMFYASPSAVIVGNVTIGEESSVWHHAVLRGDTEIIVVGKQTNVQDNCVVHADAGFPTRIGSRVTVGHGAIVHGCTVEDEAVIGMGAIVTNGARIGAASFVGAGAVVPEGMQVPARSIALGVPARAGKLVNPEHVARMRHGWKNYIELARKELEERGAPPSGGRK